MQTNLLVFYVIIVSLLTFFVVSVLPTTNALTARTDFSNRHTSASMGNSIVCGDHICSPGEHYKSFGNTSQSQNRGYGKTGPTNSGIIWHNICGGVRC
jgi:hypothetical protein